MSGDEAEEEVEAEEAEEEGDRNEAGVVRELETGADNDVEASPEYFLWFATDLAKELAKELAVDNDETDLRILVWYIEENYPKVASSHDFAPYRLTYQRLLKHRGDLHPSPSLKLCERFQNELGEDLMGWIEGRKVPSEARKVDKDSTATGAKYKCNLCDKPLNGHTCQPTREQVVARVRSKVLKELGSNTSPTRSPQSEASNSSSSKGPRLPYNCSKCGKRKKGHICHLGPMERIVTSVLDALMDMESVPDNPILEEMIRDAIDSELRENLRNVMGGPLENLLVASADAARNGNVGTRNYVGMQTVAPMGTLTPVEAPAWNSNVDSMESSSSTNPPRTSAQARVNIERLRQRNWSEEEQVRLFSHLCHSESCSSCLTNNNRTTHSLVASQFGWRIPREIQSLKEEERWMIWKCRNIYLFCSRSRQPEKRSPVVVFRAVQWCLWFHLLMRSLWSCL
jgi:hypothetical protein